MRLRLLLVGLVAVACREEPEVWALALPDYFPEPVIPEGNPLTREKVELGRALFYDTRLSGNQTQACSSCHLQELAFTDGRTTGLGSTGMVHPRNANGLTNVAYNSTLTWANPLLTDLETQILIPLFGDDPVEMGASPGEDEVLARLAGDPARVEQYQAAWPDAAEPVTWDTTIDALASFTRTLISADSPFDRYAFQQDASALSEAELRGMQLFFSEELECHHCHGGFNFSEASTHADSPFDATLFQNTGLYDVDGLGAYPPGNTGLHAITGEPADMGRFRAPSLRNVGVTAPYMHDGSVATLEEVIDIYARGGRSIDDGPFAGDGRDSPLKSGLVAGFELTASEKADLVAFLHTLTDTTFLTDPTLAAP